MVWTEIRNQKSAPEYNAVAFGQACDKTSEICSREANEIPADRTGGVAWKAHENAVTASAMETVDKYFGKADSILPSELPSEKPKKKDRDFDDAPAKYAAVSNVEPERAEQKIAAQPRANGNHLAPEQARDVIAENTMGSLTVPGVGQVASKVYLEPKPENQSVPERRSLLLSDHMHSSNDSSNLHDLATVERVTKETPSATLSNERSQFSQNGRPSDLSQPEAQNSHGGLDTVSHHGCSEQSVLTSPERKASSESLKESLTGAHTAEQSARPSLQLSAEAPTTHESPSHAIVGGPVQNAELSRTVPNEGHSKGHVFGDPRVMAKNDSFDIHRTAPSESRKLENAVPPEISHTSESCEPNRIPCGRSFAHRDETLISGLNDYTPSNRKAQPTEAGFSNRQHSVNQVDDAIIMENARRPIGQRSEYGTSSGGGGATGSRVKEDITPGASVKNTTGRFDGVGTGSTTGSNGTSRETPRIPQKETVAPTSPGRSDGVQPSGSEAIRGDRTQQSSGAANGGGGGSGGSGRSFGDGKTSSRAPEAGTRNDSASSSSGRGRGEKEGETNGGSLRTGDRGERGSSIRRTDPETCNSSPVASKRGGRPEQASGTRGVRNGFNNDAGAAVQLIDSERRNGQISINVGKRGEKIDNVNNDRKNGSFTSELISTIRTLDWQLIGKWVSAIKIDRWIEHLDWKSAAKIHCDFGMTRRNDDASKGTGIGFKAAKEFQVRMPERGNSNAMEQVANAKRNGVNPSLDELGDVSRSAKEAVRINNANRWVEAAAVINALHPTEALKQFLARVEAEERKWDAKIESCRTNLQDKSPRRIDRHFDLIVTDGRGERGERAKILSLAGKLVPTGPENTKGARREGDAVRQSWSMNFSVPEKPQDPTEEDDEPITFKLDVTSVSASSNQQNQQSQSTPTGQTQDHTQYTVRSGDTVRSIAFRLFSDTRIAELILNLNRELLTSDCALPLRAGIVLWLPNQTEINSFYWSRQSAGLSCAV